jgi:hypothetical protein
VWVQNGQRVSEARTWRPQRAQTTNSSMAPLSPRPSRASTANADLAGSPPSLVGAPWRPVANRLASVANQHHAGDAARRNGHLATAARQRKGVHASRGIDHSHSARDRRRTRTAALCELLDAHSRRDPHDPNFARLEAHLSLGAPTRGACVAQRGCGFRARRPWRRRAVGRLHIAVVGCGGTTFTDAARTTHSVGPTSPASGVDDDVPAARTNRESRRDDERSRYSKCHASGGHRVAAKRAEAIRGANVAVAMWARGKHGGIVAEPETGV